MQVRWEDVTGTFLEDLPAFLTDDLRRRLANEFEMYSELCGEEKVSDAGLRIWANLLDEPFKRKCFRRSFAARVASLLKSTTAGLSRRDFCCAFHRARYQALCRRLNSGSSGWLRDLFQLVGAWRYVSAQLPSHYKVCREDPASVTLSRFMTIRNFARHHLKGGSLEKRINRVRRYLSHKIRSPMRREVLNQERIGVLIGTIGSYASVEGVAAEYEYFCNSRFPFATFTREVDAISDRSGEPTEVLKKLGLTFSEGSHWIELQYSVEDARIRYANRPSTLAVPTVVDADCDWAFLPERDSPPKWGYARDLSGDSDRGLPEVIHTPFSPHRLSDAVVWGEPTKSAWCAT